MNRWVKIGGAVLLLIWAPFLYAELTSSPQEKKDREIREASSDGTEVATVPAEPAEGTAEEPAAADEDPADPNAKAGLPDKPTVAVPNKPEGEPALDPDKAEALEDQADPETAPDAPLPAKAGPVVALKGAFDQEPRDALWAKDTEARINAILSGGDVPEGFFERAACRKAVCRIDMRWTQENAAPYLDAYESLHTAFAGDIAVDPQLAAGATPPEEGIPIHVYVMRSGYTVADL